MVCRFLITQRARLREIPIHRQVTQNRGEKNVRNITDAPQGLHLPTPYNLLSLRDLYTQIPDSTGTSEAFRVRCLSRIAILLSANRLGGASERTASRRPDRS